MGTGARVGAGARGWGGNGPEVVGRAETAGGERGGVGVRRIGGVCRASAGFASAGGASLRIGADRFRPGRESVMSRVAANDPRIKRSPFITAKPQFALAA